VALLLAPWTGWVARPSFAESVPPPPEAFFGRSAVRDAKLSPSGRWLAVSVQVDRKRVGLAVVDLDAPDRVTAVAGFNDVDIDEFHWVGDERLVFDVIDLDQASGERRLWPGLYSVKRDGTEPRQLVRLEQPTFTERVAVLERVLHPRHLLLHVPAGVGSEVIVGEWRFTGTGDLESVLPKRLDIVTGRTRSLAQGAPAHVFDWLFDSDGTPRVAVAVHEGRTKVYWREREQEGWTVLSEADTLRLPWKVHHIDAEGRLYVTEGSGPGGESVLKRFDFQTGRPQAEPLLATPGFDVSGGLVTETPGGAALGVRTVTDAETTVWFSPSLQAVQQEIDSRLPGRINRLTCRRCGQPGMTVLVNSWSDREPGEYWVWRAQPALWSRLARVRPAIDAAQMGTLDLHRIRARDGGDLPVWVTTPPRMKPGERRPAVVLVHGGPWLRGVSWAWHAQAQFLATRGWIVIEPEFRGSTGYGAVHFKAGWKHWGTTMQDDVADATRWAAREAGVDAGRVCIAGGSYGGYAVLMGLLREPGLYRCGAAWVAVTEPRLLFEWSYRSDVSDESRLFSLPTLLGDPATDAEMLAAASPLAQAERLRAPLLLAFGELDRRVPLVHGTRLRAALKAAGNDPEWVVYPGEGHSWQLPETRIDFARRLEAFLARQFH
jgi:dipeptidyl aminopeptidase/acylaminoacyl peptidase